MNIHIHTWFTQDESSSFIGGEAHRGRMTVASLQGLGMPHDAQAYVCGPTSFIEAATAALTASGVQPGAVATELFGALAAVNPGVVDPDIEPPHLPAHLGSGPTVTFARSLLEVPWSDEYRTLLDLAEACSVPTRWVCRTGVCHTCVTPLVAGDVTYVEEPLTAPDPGTALICCAAPRSEVVLDL
jgi:ferredoxin